MNETVFLVAFFKFDNRGPEWGFKRIDLEVIFKTEQEALRNISFCDEAGWYEGALIEERMLGYHDMVFQRQTDMVNPELRWGSPAY